MISHGILPILPPNCTKFVFFFAITKKLSSDLESLHFGMLCGECKIGKRDGHEKIKNIQIFRKSLLSPEFSIELHLHPC